MIPLSDIRQQSRQQSRQQQSRAATESDTTRQHFTHIHVQACACAHTYT